MASAVAYAEDAIDATVVVVPTTAQDRFKQSTLEARR